MMEKYRVFVEDVGSRRFSGFGASDIEADSPLDAIFEATGVVRSSPIGRKWTNGDVKPLYCGCRLIALPHSRKDLWPNSRTGQVPKEALKFNSNRQEL